MANLPKESSLLITYQCIDELTDPSSFTKGWVKDGFEGFRLTNYGEKKAEDGDIILNNGKSEDACHYVAERLGSSWHAVVQQAGPNINMIPVYGAVFIDNDKNEIVPIESSRAKEILLKTLSRMSKDLLGKGFDPGEITLQIAGHDLCGDIRQHGSVDIAEIMGFEDDRIVTVPEYLLGEEKLIRKHRKNQMEVLMEVLEEVFIGKKVTIEVLAQMQPKFPGNPNEQQAFVDKAIGQKTPGVCDSITNNKI